ncbi:MAG: GNAT family N-acetyltransferase [Ilumatobacteraceae bacterium]
MATTADVVDNTARKQLELPVDDHLAFLTYTLDDGVLALVHTEVPEELGGRGLGGVLVQAALDKATAEGDAVHLVCPFAKAWVDKHPDAVTAIEVK